MATTQRSMLGVGIYSPREAARYVRARTEKFRRWIYGTRDSEPVFDPDIPRQGSSEIVTFMDFAQALRVNDIRLNIHIPLQKIREAYEVARNEHHIKHPFAMKNSILVFGNLNDPAKCALVLCTERDAQDEQFLQKKREKYIQLTGKKKGNELISEVVQKFSEQLIYSEDGIATEYVAYEGMGHRILIEPDVRFGKPYVEGFVYEAETLANAVTDEGGVDRVSDLYEVPESAIQVSLAYMRELEKEPPPITPKKIAA